jgi:hypothetical protein
MPTTGLQPAAHEFFAAIERRDADAAGALLAPDGVVHDEGEGLDVVGPAATADWVRSHLIGPGVRLELRDLADADGTVLARADAVVPGARSLPFTYRFVGTADGLSDLRISPAW